MRAAAGWSETAPKNRMALRPAKHVCRVLLMRSFLPDTRIDGGGTNPTGIRTSDRLRLFGGGITLVLYRAAGSSGGSAGHGTLKHGCGIVKRDGSSRS